MSNVNKLLKCKATEIWNIAPDETVYRALEVMKEKNIGALVVVKDEQLIGILSERDYARKITLESKSSKETLVMDIMTRRVCYTTPEQNIEECMVLMTEKKIRHLPVLENNKLIGMISLGDVVKEIIQDQKHKIKELENYITWEESY